MGNSHSNKQQSNKHLNKQKNESTKQLQIQQQISPANDNNHHQLNSLSESHSQLNSYSSPIRPSDNNHFVINEPFPQQYHCDSNEAITVLIPNPSLPSYCRRSTNFSFHPTSGDFAFPNCLDTVPQSEARQKDYNDSNNHYRYALKASHSFGGCRMTGQMSSASTIAANPHLGSLWQPPGRFSEINARRQRVDCSELHAYGEVDSTYAINEDELCIVGGSDTTSSSEGTQPIKLSNDKRNDKTKGVSCNGNIGKLDFPSFPRLGENNRGRLFTANEGEYSQLLQRSNRYSDGTDVSAFHHVDSTDYRYLQHSYIQPERFLPPSPFVTVRGQPITAMYINKEDHPNRIDIGISYSANRSTVPMCYNHETDIQTNEGNEVKPTRLRSTSADRIEVLLKPISKGYAVKSYRNGDRYEGELIRGKRDGYGLMFMSNGEVYAGQWSQDVRNGRGLQFYAPWGRYEGDFRLDMRSGWGTLIMKRHGIFVGQFLNNKKHGRGILIHPRGEVFAEWWNYGKISKRIWLKEILAYERRSKKLSHRHLQVQHHKEHPQQVLNHCPLIRTLLSDVSSPSRTVSKQNNKVDDRNQVDSTVVVLPHKTEQNSYYPITNTKLHHSANDLQSENITDYPQIRPAECSPVSYSNKIPLVSHQRWMNSFIPTNNEHLITIHKPQSTMYNCRDVCHLRPIAESNDFSTKININNQNCSLSISHHKLSTLDHQIDLMENLSHPSIDLDATHPPLIKAELRNSIVPHKTKKELFNVKDNNETIHTRLKLNTIDQAPTQFDSVLSTADSSTLQTLLCASEPSSSQYTGSACLSSKKSQYLSSSEKHCLCSLCRRRSNSVMSAFVCAVGRRFEGFQSHHIYNRNRPSSLRLSICSDSSLPSIERFDADHRRSLYLLRSNGLDRGISNTNHPTHVIERYTSLPEQFVSNTSSSSDENNSNSGHSNSNSKQALAKTRIRNFSQSKSQCLAISDKDPVGLINAEENVGVEGTANQTLECPARKAEPEISAPNSNSYIILSNRDTMKTGERNVEQERPDLQKRKIKMDNELTQINNELIFTYQQQQQPPDDIQRISTNGTFGVEHASSLQQSSYLDLTKDDPKNGSIVSSIVSSSTILDQNTLPELVKWSTDDVGEFMKCLGLSQMVAIFQKNQIGGEELINLTEEDLENELRIRDATHRQIVVQAAQALSRCEAKRRFQGKPWVEILRYLRELFRECLISSAAVRRCRVVGEGGFGVVYKGFWGTETEVAIKAFRMASFTAVPRKTTATTLKKDVFLPQPHLPKKRIDYQSMVHEDVDQKDTCDLSQQSQPIESDGRKQYQTRLMEKKCHHEDRVAERHKQRLALMLLDLADEAKVLMSLRHPNVTRFWGVCLDTERQWLVTQYIPGGSLFSLIHSNRGVLLNSVRITQIALGICSGMAYVHSKGLLHCDLKSPNILLDENQEPKICDFGLALQSLDCPTAATRGRIGTPQWMAPEVLRGSEYSKAADVYSFGVILWEMLSRRIPYANMTLNHIIAAVGWGNHHLDVVYHCPEILNRLMKCCLHRISTHRPTFEMLVEELSILLDSEDIESDTGRLLAKPFRKFKESTRRTLNSVESLIFGPPL